MTLKCLHNGAISKIATLEEALEQRIEFVLSKYLMKHCQPEHSLDDFGLLPSNDEQLDIEACCLVCHAAFEEYIEQTLLVFTQNQIESYKQTGFPNETVLSLSMFSGDISSSIANDSQLKNLHALFSKQIERMYSKYEKATGVNHGISMKYLRDLLPKIGLPLNHDSGQVSAISLLANKRGIFAHTFSNSLRTKRPWGAQQCETTIKDCLDLCKALTARMKVKMDTTLVHTNSCHQTTILNLLTTLRLLHQKKSDKFKKTLNVAKAS